MGSLKVLLVCATLVVAALGKNDTPVLNPTRSLTSGVPGPTATPHPPPPALNTIYSYTSPVSKTCTIMLNASMVVTFTYTNTTKEACETTEELDGVAVVDKAASHCRDQDSAALVLTWKGTAGDPRLLSFNFTGNGQVNWEFKNLTLTFNVTDKDFPDYPTKDFSTFANFSRAGFFDEVSSTVEYQRSYQCSANTLYKFNNFTNQELKVTIDVTNFQVQAFKFKDNKIVFGNARKCVADGAPGSKIVPIAVGAALGVLVIAVIVAYVISKVVNRKKSSYEAL